MHAGFPFFRENKFIMLIPCINRNKCYIKNVNRFFAVKAEGSVSNGLICWGAKASRSLRRANYSSHSYSERIGWLQKKRVLAGHVIEDPP